MVWTVVSRSLVIGVRSLACLGYCGVTVVVLLGNSGGVWCVWGCGFRHQVKTPNASIHPFSLSPHLSYVTLTRAVTASVMTPNAAAALPPCNNKH
ncbi:hypothetical protein Droror1_Dr00024368 [Drosera rotundifolia]